MMIANEYLVKLANYLNCNNCPFSKECQDSKEDSCIKVISSLISQNENVNFTLADVLNDINDLPYHWYGRDLKEVRRVVDLEDVVSVVKKYLSGDE